MRNLTSEERSALARSAAIARWAPPPVPIAVVIRQALQEVRLTGKVQLFFLDGNHAWHCWRDEPSNQRNIEKWCAENFLLITCDRITTFRDVMDEVISA